MRLDMIASIHIQPALEKAGCPICKLRNTAETRYLENLLHEYVNDYDTRVQIIASLGYCPKHAWQMGLMEKELFGDAVGNAIIYENLVQVVLQPLGSYIKRMEGERQTNRSLSRLIAWIRTVLNLPAAGPPDPFGSLIQSSCRACQIGENAEDYYLEWLLRGLSDPEPELREDYARSDGLCLQHFRRVLSMRTGATESGARFVLSRMLEKLPELYGDLREYTNKHAWDRHNEDLLPEERTAWVRAIRFFAGNEGNVLLDELDETPGDDRIHSMVNAKFG